MMGMQFHGEKPFYDVVIHELVRAADGRKMSKSAGNALDPLHARRTLRRRRGAVRPGAVGGAGHDIPLNEDWIDAGRRCGNELWNAVHFAVDHAEVRRVPLTGGHRRARGPKTAGSWAGWRGRRRLRPSAGPLPLLEAVTTLHNFAWSEVFDWYLEMAKALLAGEAGRRPG